MTCFTTRIGHLLATGLLIVLLTAACSPTATETEQAADSNTTTQTDAPTALSRLAQLRAEFDRSDQSQHQHLAQMIAFGEAELGRYLEAERSFPFAPQRFPVDLPAPDSHRAVDAVDGIADLAGDRRLVMINEAHHLPRHRTLTSALLPRLRALGFTHFAAEALDPNDHDIAQRGHVRNDSASMYLREPRYGDLVRQALALGFVLVAYEVDSSTPETREAGQARNLYASVFVDNPDARLVVHTGYAHIDEAPSQRLWHIEPLAMRLKALTGIDPLTVDQTLLPETSSADAATPGIVDLAGQFGLSRPSILLANADDSVWRIRPDLHDVSVVWPPDADIASQRPDWLMLDGRRLPWPVDPALCRERFPCVVEATLASEPAEAVAIDRYAFFDSGEPEVPLWLSPGRYRVTARDQSGKPLSEERIILAQRPPR